MDPIHHLLSVHWIIYLTVTIVALWAGLRFVLIPQGRRLKIKRSLRSCPSLRLPGFGKNLSNDRKVPSRRRDKKEYRVNLYRLTCTCQRFRKRRWLYPRQDIRRLCRHLRKELERSNLLLQFDELIQTIIDHRVKDSCYKIIQVGKEDIAIGFHPRRDYARIYTRRLAPGDPPEGPPTGNYDKFTLLLSQEIWVYGEAAPNSETLIPMVMETIRHYRNIAHSNQGGPTV